MYSILCNCMYMCRYVCYGRQYKKTKSKSHSPPENDKRKDNGGTADDCSSYEDVIESDEDCTCQCWSLVGVTTITL